MFKKIILLNISLVMLLSSCNIFSESESEVLGLDYSIGIESTRTIIPNFNLEIDHYTITGSDDSGTNTINQNISSESGTITNITEGTWNFIVSAYDSSDNKLASGSGSTIISWSKENTISIALNYIQYLTQVSTGNVSITINWPDEFDPYNVTINWAEDSAEYVDISGKNTYILSKIGQTSGSNYKVILKFEDISGYNSFSVSEAVQFMMA